MRLAGRSLLFRGVGGWWYCCGDSRALAEAWREGRNLNGRSSLLELICVRTSSATHTNWLARIPAMPKYSLGLP